KAQRPIPGRSPRPVRVDATRDEYAAGLTRLRPRGHLHYVSQGRTVLTTEADGFISGDGEAGLFVHETRLLSRYRYLIDGRLPDPNALSNVEQYSWLGYYVLLVPGVDAGPADEGSGQVQEVSQQTLELRLSRYVGDGVHEDVDLTNYTQHPTSFRLDLKIDADFADPY